MAQSEPEQRSMTDDEHKQLREAIEELRNETRQYLADELGGEPDDYRNSDES